MFKKRKLESSSKKNNLTKRNGVYFEPGRRKRKRYLMIVVPIVAVVIGVIVASSSIYSSEINQYGVLGSAHVHSVFPVKLNDLPLDFSKPEFQVQSRLIHVEGGDGSTLHRHTDKVQFGEFLRSVNMGIDRECFFMTNGAREGEQKFCNTNGVKLRVFVNGQELERSARNQSISNIRGATVT